MKRALSSTVAGKQFVWFLLTFGASVLGYFLTQPYLPHSKEAGDGIWRRSFSPVQVEGLRRFLEGAGPGEQRVAELEAGKEYRLATLVLENLSEGQKLTLRSTSEKKRAILVFRHTPIRVRNSAQITFRNLHFRSTSSAPLFLIENCQSLRFENCRFEVPKTVAKIVASEKIGFHQSELSVEKGPALVGEGVQNFLVAASTIEGKLGRGIGVLIEQNAKEVTLTKVVLRNFRIGLQVSDSSVSLWESEVVGNQIGLFWKKKGRGQIGDLRRPNRILKNRQYGLLLQNSSPQVFGNQFLQNGEAGIYLEQSSGSEIRGNQMGENLYGLVALGKVTPTVWENKVYQNKQHGLSWRSGASGEIRENQIYENGDAGIFLRRCSPQLQIRNNEIQRNKGFGIYISDMPQSFFERIKAFPNEIRDNHDGAIGPVGD